MSTTMSVSELAQVLFTCGLQATDDPSPGQVRAAIEARLGACHGDCAACAACVAQEAGDHPEQYAVRMRWALTTVGRAYFGDLAAAA
jgi:hypothetical protein